MDQFFCFAKKDFCDNHADCSSCELSDGEGGIYIEDFNKILVSFFGKGYGVDHLRKLVEEEARLRDSETTHRTEMCEDGYDCVELGKARMALRGAVARAVKAEADFAEARKYICKICTERSCRGEDCRWFSWKDKGAK